MGRRIGAIVIAAVLAITVVAAVALLPRSSQPVGHIAVRGAAGPRSALDMAGGSAAATRADTDTTSAPAGAPGPAPVPGTSPAPSPGPATTPAPTSTSLRPPGTTSGSSVPSPAQPTTTVPQVATSGPATGRLAVSLVGASGSRAIATMAADGSSERVLATGNYFHPRWTPDGRFVVFDSTDVFASWAVPAGGGPVTRLGDGASAVVSPDGARIINVMAVPYATGPPLLTVQKIAETAAGLVTVGPATALGVSGVGPVWSPDGRHILYGNQMGGSSSLTIVNADGTGGRELPVNASGMDSAGFSADSSTISFVGTDTTAYFIGANGQGLRPALPATIPGVPGLGAFVTSWSHDHEHLAVLVNGGRTIVVVDTSGHVVTTAYLTVGAMPIGVAFDGSGQYAYYMGTVGTFPNITTPLYSIALYGGTSRRLGSDASATFPLSVSAN